MLRSLLTQLKTRYLFLVGLFLLPVLFILGVMATSLGTVIPIETFTRDPTTVAGIHPLTGLLSNIGVITWCATATICFFSSAVLRLRRQSGEYVSFLAGSGLLTALLLFDDFFLLHDYILPIHFGVSEKAFLLVYAVLMIVGLVRFREAILKTEYVVLLIGLGFLGASLIIDALQSNIGSLIGSGRILLEDGFKLLGITGWFGYFLHSCLRLLSGGDLISFENNR